MQRTILVLTETTILVTPAKVLRHDNGTPNQYVVVVDESTPPAAVDGTEYNSASGNADRAWECDPNRDPTPGTDFSCANNGGTNYGAAVSIWAPAWNVLGASGFSNTGYRPMGSASSGTSFAAPLVTGVVARILQKYPARSKPVDDIWTELRDAASSNPYTGDFDEDASVYNNKLLYAAPSQ